MKVLVTGGAGFVGGHLAYSLASEGYDVTLVDNFRRGVYDPFIEFCVNGLNVRLLEKDLLDQDALSDLSSDFSYVYHMAAIIGVAHVMRQPYEVLADNVRMTDNVIRFCRRQSKLRRLVFSSTSEVYAGSLIHFDMAIPTPETAPIALTSLEQPRTSYMLSKIYGEAMCNMSGMPVTNLRLHNVYGPRMGMSHVIPELLFKAWKAKDGDILEVFSVEHRRTFCFVSDAVRMIRALAESERAEGQTVNIGNQSPEVSIQELADVVVSTVGRRLDLVPRPATIGSPIRRCPNTERLRDLTGVNGSVSLVEGVHLTFDWYLSNVFQGGVTAN